MLTEENGKILLEKARQSEKVCDWKNALKLYQQAAESYLQSTTK